MQIPKNGFYYHYKHDESKGFNDHAYEVVGIGQHSEDATKLVLYRPLYEASDIAPATYFARPLEMFFEEVAVNKKLLPRFIKITDPELIAKLIEIKNQIYK